MIINNSNFLINEVPNFHPISQRYDYLDWWRSQKRACIEGKWFSGKWMPGTLYYYTNFHTISVESKEAQGRLLGRPWLRDIEWEKAYIYEEACGFSGFSGDEKYTCNRQYGPEKQQALEFEWITQEELDSKIYVSAREYLRKNHFIDLGKPLYNNQAKNVIDLECFTKSTEVMMANGSIKYIEDIKIGDRVMGPDSKPRNVLATHNGVDDMYEIKSKRFDSYICNSKHQIALFKRERLNGKYVDGVREPGIYKTSYDSISLGELLEKQSQSSFTDRFYLYQGSKLNFEGETTIPIDPYFIGYWLADGRSNTVSIKSVDKESIDNLTLGNRVIRTHDAVGNRQQAFEIKWLKDKNPEIYEIIKPMLYNKHIPQYIKTASLEQRLQLLAGIIDGDGCYDKKANSYDIYAGLNKKLADDICFVARTCGFYSNITKRVRAGYSDTYKVIISGNIWNIPCKYKRKKAKFVDRRINVKHSSFEIIPKKIDVFYGIEVDGDNLFLLSNCVTVHNSRGGGKSFWSSGLINHNFLFDGATDYDYYLDKISKGETLRSDTVVGAVEAKFSSDLLSKSKVAFENLPGRQEINGEVFESPLYKTFTGSMASGKDFYSAKSKSVIHHRTFADDPLAANGTRPNRAFLEEVGFLSSIIEVWGALESTQQSSEFRNLVIYGLGTGGLTKAGAALYAKEVFYNPEDYNCLAFDDKWENKGKIGFFLPAIKTLNKFKETDNYITNDEKSLKFIEGNRAKAKESNSKLRYITERINAPLVPSEIFLTTEGGIFPIEDLNARLATLESNRTILNSTYKVRFNLIEGKPQLTTTTKGVIREYPVRRGIDLDSAIELFELPKKDHNGNIPWGKYIAGWDPVDVDGNDDITQSLQSVFIMDLWTNRIVAEYTGRTRIAEDYYEQVRRLLLFYNAICNYENNIKGPYGYFKNKNSLHLLAETPDILKDQNLLKGSTIGNKALGTRTNNEIINYGLGLQVSWMDGEAYNTDNGSMNLDTVESPGLIKEWIAFDKDINCDRVSAMNMLMILKEDRARATDIAINKRVTTKASDPFWDRAFKKDIYNTSAR